MNVEQISLPKDEAERLYQEYRTALKGKRDAFLHELKVAYGHMRHGRAVVDVHQALKESGLDHNFDPRLAIVRADYPVCRFFKRASDRGIFTGHDRLAGYKDPDGAYVDDVVAPAGTYATWPRGRDRDGRVRAWDIPRSALSTQTPPIPPRFMPNGNLSNYYVLWEPAGWKDDTPKPPPPPKDPLLLKRVSANVFVALAGWDLTDVERAVLRGRIA